MGFVADHLGEAAALGAATSWMFTSLAFAAATRRIGPSLVNLLRILLAWVVLVAIHRLYVGSWLPDATDASIVLLSISGVIGFAIGDQFGFMAFLAIGPRLTTLLMTVTPPVVAGIAWLALDEPLTLSAMLGIALTLAGIVWVVRERPDTRSAQAAPPRHRARGVLYAALAAVCQAVGLILSKVGMGHMGWASEVRLEAWSASLIRVTAGATVICLLAMVRRAGRSATAAGSTIQFGIDPSHRAAKPGSGRSVKVEALVLLSVGAVLGPVVGVWCSLVAIDRANAGVAATLMSLTPVFILPFAVLIEGERVTWRSALGAVVAVAGVAVLMASNGGEG